MLFIILFLFFERKVLVPYFSYWYLHKNYFDLNVVNLCVFSKVLLLYQNLLLDFLTLKVKDVVFQIETLNGKTSFWDNLLYKFFSSLEREKHITDRKRLIKSKKFYQKAIKILKSNIILKNDDLSLRNFNRIAKDVNFAIDGFVLKDNIYENINPKPTFATDSVIKISSALIKYPFRSCLYINLNRCGNELPSYLRVVRKLARTLGLDFFDIISNLKNNLTDLNYDITYEDYLAILNESDVKFIQDFISSIFLYYLENLMSGAKEAAASYEKALYTYTVSDMPWWHPGRIGLITKRQRFFKHIILFFIAYPSVRDHKEEGFHCNARHNELAHYLSEEKRLKGIINDLYICEIEIKSGNNSGFIKNGIFFRDTFIINMFNRVSYSHKGRDRSSCAYFLLKFFLKNNIALSFKYEKDDIFADRDFGEKIQRLANVLDVSFNDIQDNLVK